MKSLFKKFILIGVFGLFLTGNTVNSLTTEQIITRAAIIGACGRIVGEITTSPLHELVILGVLSYGFGDFENSHQERENSIVKYINMTKVSQHCGVMMVANLFVHQMAKSMIKYLNN